MGPMFVRSQPDPVLLSDIRVLHNLLVSESHHQRVRVRDYMAQVQQLITPNHRKIVTDWMLEVCEDQHFHPEVYFHAINYLDRFLCIQLVGRDTLQLVGLTALWLAAKQEELVPPGLEQLVTLAAESYTEINFRHMELLILAKLELRLAAPTPAYLLNHMIAAEEERDWPGSSWR